MLSMMNWPVFCPVLRPQVSLLLPKTMEGVADER